MAFTYDPTEMDTDLAKLRLAIGDTADGAGPRPDGSNFSDEELSVFLVEALAAGGTWRTAAVQVLRVLANQYAAAAKSTRDAEISEDLTGTAAVLREQAADFERSTTTSGAPVSQGMTAGLISLGHLLPEWGQR